jgi:hypothetical protein
MKSDLTKMLLVYGIVGFTVVAGIFTMYLTTVRSDIPATADVHGYQVIIAGFVGACIQFLTGSEIATRATRSTTTAFTAGSTASTPTITSSGGPPPSVTVTAPAPTDTTEATDG